MNNFLMRKLTPQPKGPYLPAPEGTPKVANKCSYQNIFLLKNKKITCKVLKIVLLSFFIIATLCGRAESGTLKSVQRFQPKEQPLLPDFLPEQPKPKAEKDLTLPQPLPEPESKESPPEGPLFILNQINFTGNTVFSDQRLEELSTPFLNREIGLADLEELRYQLTRLYVDQGYPNSGALLLPGQEVSDGEITYTIIEGRLTQVKITGNGWLRPEYISKRVWPDPEIPFNTELLQERFQMLLQDDLISRMQGRILPGTKPGEAILDLDVIREEPYELSVSFNNHASPSLGAERLLINGVLHNLTGFGDSLNLWLIHTQGTKEIDASFAIPLNYRNTILSFSYNRSDNDVVEEPLDDLDVESKLESAKISLTHPLYHTLQRQFDLGITLDTQESKTWLLGRSFSFSEGYENGKSRVTALRLIQAFQDRDINHAFILRSTLSFGLGLFNATTHSDGRSDSRFISWLGQFQYARRLGKKLGQVIFKGDLQLASDTLLSMEQFAIGGATTVRGYRENEVVRDNGYDLSLEWRIPLWQRQVQEEQPATLQIAPFFDYGSGWRKGRSPSKNRLYSAGAGLLWSSKKIDADIYIAHAFRDVGFHPEHDLQDDGIHFNLTIKLF